MRIEEWSKKNKEYKKRFREFGYSLKSLKWHSTSAMKSRHRELISDLSIEGKTILDVGCGFGNLIDTLSSKSENFEYTGVDFVSEFIKVCKKKYPEHKFLEANYFEKPIPGKFDIVLCSGALNWVSDKPMEFRKEAIKIMFDHAIEAVCFNMAGHYPLLYSQEKRGIYYADSLEVLKYCLSLSEKIIFKQHYRKSDFTIILFR